MSMQSELIITAARELLKAHGYFVDNLWHTDDINFLCEQKGYQPLDLAGAMAVFDIANEHFDGEYGICWPQLERALDIFQQRKNIVDHLCEDSLGEMQ